MFKFPFWDSDSLRVFMSEYWGGKYYKFAISDVKTFSQKEIVSNIIDNNKLHYPKIRLMTRDGTVNPLLYTDSDRRKLSDKINKKKIIDLIGDPVTIKIEDINELDPELVEASKKMSKFFDGSHISMNCYLSSGPAYGIAGHYDPYHIFIVQLEGCKKWELGEKIVSSPHKNFHIKKSNPPSNPTIVHTNPGDVLYLPPGLWHATYTQNTSTHLAIGVHTERYFEKILTQVENLAANFAEFRADLPFDVNNDGLKYRKIDKNSAEKISEIIKIELLK